jgi:predicted AAA+ superfamily ATPase
MLKRNITKQLFSDLEYFPVVGIIGPRQAGKTTLAKHIISHLEDTKSIYLDLELDTDRKKLENAETYLTYHQDKCVVIDEVQRMPKLFPLLRALIDMDRRPGRYILLGSASPEMIKGSSETLAGRISYNELTPFSWLEVKENTQLYHHWLTGGFPKAMLASNPEHTHRWLKAFTETFIQRDLQELGHQISTPIVTRMLEMIASMHGQVLNQSNLARSLGVTAPTVNRYLDLLEGGFIITKLQPYFVNIGKRLVKQPKLYIRDTGILHNLLGIRNIEQLLGHVIVGASWEGYVIEQIRRCTMDEIKIYFYRTHKGAESDIIIVAPSGKKYCIEIKRSQSASISRGFFEVIKDVKPQHSYIISETGEQYPKKNGIQMTNLETFLIETLPTIIET